MGQIVKTSHGELEGSSQHGVLAFRAVPYAQPPLGALRFAAPEPASSWNGTRAAQRYGPSAPQIGPVNRFIRSLIAATGSTQSQDCLYLNIWTPAADRRRRPVMVWLHGGAFILGSGSTALYAGWRLARRGDVVVVTLNYRLGALGFLRWRTLCGEAERPPDNVGLLDQIAALQWVRANIEDFGGDPNNVTLFGESAGAMSVGALLGAPRAEGLFQRAILQSGAAHNVSQPETADRITALFVESLGIERTDPATLRKLSVGEIMRAQALVSARADLAGGVLAWQPCIDGALLPEHPLAAIAHGASAGVETLLGTNRDEWKLFMLGDRRRRSLAEDALTARFERALKGTCAEPSTAGKAYARVAGPRGGEPSERWASFQSDRVFHYPATRLADVLSETRERTYTYLFSWSPPLTGRWPGACHGLELPFVFGSLQGPLLRASLGISARAQRLCDRMQDSWIGFARSGSPGHDDLPDWPAYSCRSRNTMVLGTHCSLREDPHRRSREFWHPVLADGKARNGGSRTGD